MTLEQLAAELMALRERVAVLESRQQHLTPVAPPQYSPPHYSPPPYEIIC